MFCAGTFKCSSSNPFKTYHTRTAKFSGKLEWGGEILSRILGTGENLAHISVHAAALKGKEFPAAKQAAHILGGAKATLGMARAFSKLEKILSGRMFYDFEKGKMHDPVDILCEVSVFIGRTAATVMHGHNLGWYNLGKHAKWVGTLAMAGFTFCITTYGVISFRELLTEIRTPYDEKSFDKSYKKKYNLTAFSTSQKQKLWHYEHSWEIKKRVADLIRSGADLLAMPYDMGLGHNIHPAVSLTGAGLCLLSTGGYLIVEWLYTGDTPPMDTTKLGRYHARSSRL